MNRERTKVVDLKKGGCFNFLGFDIRLNCNRKDKTYVSKTPRKKKRTEIGKRVRAVLKANWKQEGIERNYRLKPYWGNPAVRNFRGSGGNVGIIEAQLAPLLYSTNLKHGSVRDVESTSMIEYCGTPHIERVEKRRKQTISKKGGL